MRRSALQGMLGGIAGVLLLLAPAGPAQAGTRWIVVTAPSLRLEDLDDARLPALQALAQDGAVGLMNTTTAAPFQADGVSNDPIASAYLTLGLGRRAAVPALQLHGLETRALPRQFTPEGWSRGVGGVAGAPRWRSDIHVGLLAAANEYGGGEALLALTAAGLRVHTGSAGTRWLQRDPARPYGVSADVEAIAREAQRVAEGVDLLWLDTGDLQRALTYAYWCLPEVAAAHRRAALGDLDRLLARLGSSGLLSKRDLLLITPVGDEERFGLTPLLWGRPEADPGLLASGATRVVGVIANTDLAPHLRASFAASDRRLTTLRVEATPRPLEALRRLQDRVRFAERARGIFMSLAKPWLMLGVLIGFAAALAPVGTRWRLLWTWPLLVPFAAILTGAAVAGSAWPLLALALLVGLVARARPAARPAGLAAGLAAILLLDLPFGATLLRWSPLGYSLTLGARYYGIGNEWMGYLVGAALIAAFARSPARPATRSAPGPGPRSASPARPASQVPGSPAPPAPRHSDRSALRRTILRAVFPFAFHPSIPLLVALIALAHPGWGANLGGALTAAVALGGVAWVGGRRWGLVLGLVLCATVLVVAVLDVRPPPAQRTHLGRMAGEMREEGLAPLVRAVRGKLATNLRLAGGYWGLLLACQAGAGLWLALPLRRRFNPAAVAVNEVPRAHGGPEHRRRVRVLLLTAAAAIAFNDSGVIAGALMLSLTPWLLVVWEGEPGHTMPEHRNTDHEH